MRNFVLIVCFLLCFNGKAQRIGNYIANGSFEEKYSCTSLSTKHWTSIDSFCGEGGTWLSVCNGWVPSSIAGYQYPHSGQSYFWTIFYYPAGNLSQIRYPRNRLKSTLQPDKIYCVKFYVNITNRSTYGMDGFGAYFGDDNLDTISYCNIPLTYLIPQIQNPQGNIITDTLNWVAITGTFTANGTEKFLVLGNFLSNEDTDTMMINPTNLPVKYTEVTIDDVSCIPIDLEAYAGRDTTIFLNDSVYIGREKDFAIDSGCVWYKLPSTTAIDTVSGMWVKPALGTHTYVVRQELECSSLKWDTVVVNVKEKVLPPPIDTTDVKVNELRIENEKLRIYPNPTSGMLNVECEKLNGKQIEIFVYDILGKELIHNSSLKTHNSIDVSGLENGIYFINISSKQHGSATKKLIISK